MQYWGMTLNRALDAWRGMWICVRSKDAQKQLARTSLRDTFNPKNNFDWYSGPRLFDRLNFDLAQHRGSVEF